MTTLNRFRAQCRLLRVATLIVFAGLVFLLLSGFIFWNEGPRAELGTSGTRITLALLVVPMLPGLGYLWALWAVQRALADIAGGRPFHPAVARAIRQMGVGVLAAALLNVFAVTNLVRMLVDGQGGYLNFDQPSIVLGVVGAALILMAQLVDQARGLQAELDEIP